MHHLKNPNTGKYSGQGRACCWCHRWDHRTGKSCHYLPLVAVLLFSKLVLVCKLFLSSWLEKGKTCWQWTKMSLSNLKYEWAVSDNVKKLQVSFSNTHLSLFVNEYYYNIWSWGAQDRATRKKCHGPAYISCYLRFALSFLHVMLVFVDNTAKTHAIRRQSGCKSMLQDLQLRMKNLKIYHEPRELQDSNDQFERLQQELMSAQVRQSVTLETTFQRHATRNFHSFHAKNPQTKWVKTRMYCKT